MAVVNVTLEWHERLARRGPGRQEAESSYRVETDDPANDDGLAVILAPQLPRTYQAHPLYPWMHCDAVEIKEWLGPSLAIVRVRWLWERSGKAPETENPLQRPPIVRMHQETTSEPIDVDCNGVPLRNSAGEAPDPPLQEEFEDHVFTIERNEAGFNNAAMDAYRRTVNQSDPTYRMRSITAQEMWEGEFLYCRATYEIVRRADGWKRRMLDEGLNYKDADGKLTPFRDKDGNPTSTAKLLDGEGHPLPEMAAPVFLLFDRFRPANWGPLGLPV